LEAGEIILTIDGQAVDPAMDLTTVLNVVLPRDMKLKVKGADDKERELSIRPMSYAAARQSLYEKWIDDNQTAVSDASEDRLGYMHIRGMNMTSFYRFERELYEVAADKDGIVIDVRENGGGSTTDHLLTILTQPVHAITVPRGGEAGYPQDRKVYATWRKPIVVLCNQNSFSNAEIFSHAIKTLKRGKVIGVPTAGGVISTGATRVMDLGLLRMPFRGWYVLGSGEDMELNGAVPHQVVWPEPGEMPAGVDKQLDRAIKTLRGDVRRWKKTARPELRKASDR
jgi:tricorn protease